MIRKTTPLGRTATLTLALVCIASTARPVTAQLDRYGSTAIEVRARSPNVVVALRMPVGSAHDSSGLEGTAWLLGEVLGARASEELAAMGATVSVQVDRSSSLIAITAESSTWRRALTTLDRILFDDPIGDSDLERQRTDLLGVMLFTDGSPIRDFENRAVSMLVEAGDAWARPIRGTRQSVAAIASSDLERARARGFVRSEAVVVWLGPAAAAPTPLTDPADGPSGPGGTGGPVGATAPVAAPVTTDRAEAIGSEWAWREGGRSQVIQDVTSTWLSVAIPLPLGTDRTTLEFATALVAEALEATGEGPAGYTFSTRLVDTPNGPVVVVDAAVEPEFADRLEGRVIAAVERLRDAPPADAFFVWSRRRFRTRRLIEDAQPLAAASRMTHDLARDAALRDLSDAIWVLNPERVGPILRRLGPARIFRLGPDLANGG